MKIKHFFLILSIINILFFSCNTNYEPPKPERTLWAQNFKTNDFYKLTAEMYYEGKYCTIWVEKGNTMTEETAKKIANEFDNNIYPKMISNFGDTFNDTAISSKIMNTLELADLKYGDGDGKLCILFLDIQDNYNPPTNLGYTAGYFWAVNCFENDPDDDLFKYSNASDMIYLDTYPAIPGSPASFQTLAAPAHRFRGYQNRTHRAES